MVLAEVEQLRRADATGDPVLGICFGGKLWAPPRGGAWSKSPVCSKFVNGIMRLPVRVLLTPEVEH